jgi:ribosomal protein S7
MPRKGPVVKAAVVADPVYNSPVVTALINSVQLLNQLFIRLLKVAVQRIKLIQLSL